MFKNLATYFLVFLVYLVIYSTLNLIIDNELDLLEPIIVGFLTVLTIYFINYFRNKKNKT